MTYDPGTQRMIMFGGALTPKDVGSPGQPLGDIWAYDPGANTWTELKSSGTLPPLA